MKVQYDMTIGQMAEELYNSFLLPKKYDMLPRVRKEIAIRSALAALSFIRDYSEPYLNSDDFWKEVKKCLLIKLNA